MNAFDVKTTPGAEGTIRLALRGELDMAAADRFDRALRAAEEGSPAHVLLDLRELRFLDSSGVRILVQALRRARAGGWRVSFVPGPETVQRVLDVTGLSSQIERSPES